MPQFDKIIIGAGIYGLYAAEYCGKRGEKVLVIEYEDAAFTRATYVNQARVHMGYHYPRSYSTAIKSAGYFERFVKDYGFCIAQDFRQVYATSGNFSWTNAEQFKLFCENANIMCEEVSPDKYFNPGLCDGAFLTKEYTFDAQILKGHFLESLGNLKNVEIWYGCRPLSITNTGGEYKIETSSGKAVRTGYLLNATYASLNQVLSLAGFAPYKIKYELCEMILCGVSDELKDIGITVMDGPFFSIMPFGKTGEHSLTSVTFTPHKTCYQTLPFFPCQEGNEAYCAAAQLGNCNRCENKPESHWPYMSSMAKKYMKGEYGFSYKRSMYSIKPILMASEIDDSRPTLIRYESREPSFVSVLSGKINTIYDLEEVIANE